MDHTQFADLRVRLSTGDPVPQSDARLVVMRVSAFAQRSVALAERARSCEAQWQEQVAGARDAVERLISQMQHAQLQGAAKCAELQERLATEGQDLEVRNVLRHLLMNTDVCHTL